MFCVHPNVTKPIKKNEIKKLNVASRLKGMTPILAVFINDSALILSA